MPLPPGPCLACMPACFSISAFLPLSCRPAHHLTFGAWPPCMVSIRPGGDAFYFGWKPKQCSSYMSLLGSSFCKPISSIDASTSVECSIANYIVQHAHLLACLHPAWKLRASCPRTYGLDSLMR